MQLRFRFLLLMTALFVGFVLIVWFFSLRWQNEINYTWGQQFAQRQVAFDKYRTLSPLIREIALAKQMAADPAIVAMASHEDDPAAKARGIAAMENYRFNFRDHTYFSAMARSGNYYFNDASNQYQGRQLRYVLSENNSNDKWFYATIKSGKLAQINVDPDVHLGVTKVWINVLIKSGDQTLGVIGTGIDLTSFLKETVSFQQSGVHNLFVDESRAIQLNNNPDLIDYMSIGKDVSQRIKVDRLFTSASDVENLRVAMEELERNPDQSRTLWVDYAGRKELLGVAYLPEIGWFDLTLMDAHGLIPIQEAWRMPALFVAALLIALLSMGYALSRWVIRPIAALQNTTERMQRGEFDVEHPVQGTGEIERLSRSFAQMAKYVGDTNRELENKVRERTDELNRMAETDVLTGLLNRRGMTDRLEKEIARQVRQDGMLGLLMLDLDRFKSINDRYGHAAGDAALREAAAVIQSLKREYDHAARWGGEEFLILLPVCDKTNLLAVAERIRDAIRNLNIRAAGQSFSLTVSIGAYHAATPQPLETLLQKVDQALYAAKGEERDCVHLLA